VESTARREIVILSRDIRCSNSHRSSNSSNLRVDIPDTVMDLLVPTWAWGKWECRPHPPISTRSIQRRRNSSKDNTSQQPRPDMHHRLLLRNKDNSQYTIKRQLQLPLPPHQDKDTDTHHRLLLPRHRRHLVAMGLIPRARELRT
jgi:hypothetical protein